MRVAAALLLSVLAAAPAVARQPYRTEEDRASRPASQGYDRPGYPPSTYDRRGVDASRSDAQDRGGAMEPSDQGAEPDLQRELNLRPDQRAAYDAYRRAFQPDEARARASQDMEGRMAGMTTPQRLDYARQEMERDRADFERTDAATRRFYAGLDAAQRRTFDRLTAPPAEGDDDGQEGAPAPGDPVRPR